ncbi:hypothetical protein TcCL_ESM03527 [Trypanosoma cruzi]|nr:hypothetical protein TcCL_ESM03527 [Trypanosoma cruzi]
MAGEVARPQPNRHLGAVSDRSEAFGRFLSAQERGPYTLGEWVLAWTPHAEPVGWNDYPQGEYLANQKSALTTQARSWRQQQLQCGDILHRAPVGGRTARRRMGFWRLSSSTRWMRASNLPNVLSMMGRSCDRLLFWPLSQSASCRRQSEAKSTQCDLSTKLSFLPCSGRDVLGGRREQLHFCCWRRVGLNWQSLFAEGCEKLPWRGVCCTSSPTECHLCR